MTAAEARAKIENEFLERYHEWFEDRTALTDREYADKYGWMKSEVLMNLKDNLTAVAFFQKYIFSGRWMPAWVKAGYDRNAIWQLSNEGFLSYQMYSNYMARATGKTDFYYLSQKTAKEIYKAHKR